eukprot:3241484-Amphidinium_carterae.1
MRLFGVAPGTDVHYEAPQFKPVPGLPAGYSVALDVYILEDTLPFSNWSVKEGSFLLAGHLCHCHHEGSITSHDKFRA